MQLPETTPQVVARSTAQAFGAYAHIAADNLYFARHGGYLYTCPFIATPPCTPHSAAVFLSACRKRFTVRLGHSTARGAFYQAVATNCTQRSVIATEVRFIVAHVSPLHPAYRAFQAIAYPGVLSIDRDLFSATDHQLQRAFLGELTPAEAGLLYDAIVAIAERQLPQPKPADARAQRWIAALRADPPLSLRTLAIESGLSYQHMSRVFRDALGISLRQFQLWQKLDRVRRVYSAHDNLTDVAHAAGFSDLAHMTRVFQRNFGAPPSYFFRNPNVRIGGAADDANRTVGGAANDANQAVGGVAKSHSPERPAANTPGRSLSVAARIASRLPQTQVPLPELLPQASQ